MRCATAVALAGAAALTPAALGAAPKPVPGGPVDLPARTNATAAARPARAGARPVELTLTLHTELQCGRLRGRSLLVNLPRAFVVPGAMARDAVLVAGGRPASVAVSGHAVALGIAPAAGLLCNSLAEGRVSVVFTRAAGLGNPAAPGSYRIAVASTGTTAVATLLVG